MKNKKKIYSFILAGLAATQVLACSKNESTSEVEVKSKEVEETETLIETTELMENDLKCDFVDEEFEIFDDVVETYEEAGAVLSSCAEQNIDDVFNIENDSVETKYFSITPEKVERQIDEYLKQDKLAEHTYNELYDEENKAIFWDKAADVVYENSQQEFLDYQNLSKEDIVYVISLLKDYCNNLKDNIDLKEVACKLSTLNLYYGVDETKELFHTAVTTSRYIAFYDSNKDIHTFDPTDSTSIHEFFHFLCFGCNCVHDRSKYYANGINIVAPEYSFEAGYKENYADLGLTGFEYTFIEEASAERVMYSYLGEIPTSYNYYQKVIDNIELVLSLNENYNLDNYVYNCLKKQPLQFLNNFTVNETNAKENFTDNLRMLVIYDSLLRYDATHENVNSQNFGKVFDNCQNYEEETQSISNLVIYSQSQLTKLFYNNLIVLNEKYADKNNLEFYSYLNQIFYARMIQVNEIYSYIWDFDSSDINIKYDEYFKQMQQTFVNYLREYYQDSSLILANVEAYGQDFMDLPEITNYPTFVSNDKIKFYENLKNELPNMDLSIPRKVSLRK